MSAHDITVRRVWFTMVLVPVKGWTRVGGAYGSEKAARGWLRFVSQAWHGLRTKTSQCTLRWKDGVMDERSRKTLSEKFNMEPPATPPNIQGVTQRDETQQSQSAQKL